jgi:hypothetical protein
VIEFNPEQLLKADSFIDVILFGISMLLRALQFSNAL